MNVLEKFTEINTFVFDVDGVLTDGTVILLENGLQARTMNVKDGLALQLAQRAGYRVLIVSGGNSAPVADRLAYLGLTEIHLGVKDKAGLVQQYLHREGLDWKTVLFMGDDLPDLPVLERCGLPCCPEDAVPEVKKRSLYISPFPGGRGCVRDVIEKVLKLAHRWNIDPNVASR
ncbi:MAG TPA: HAD hydrolase family protein [Chitinophagaceae bacterium]|jgi:3-deoxy-D-manno-octulosonate 8-phosphate phosphatase (KDO 8-P phosphatase)|nr:HAD hydrolase family protein [Chitinophagaceae bacterium]